MNRPQKQILAANWVLPISGPAIEDGMVVLEGQKIRLVGSRKEVLSALEQNISDYEICEYGKSIILPGLINLHTHLDYSTLRLLDTSPGLFNWILDMTSRASSWSPEQFLKSALLGASEIALSGTTCVADSSYSGVAAPALAAYGLRGVVGLELFGLDSTRADITWQAWEARREALLSREDEGFQASLNEGLIALTVAPHAPYTVSPPLWAKAITFADSLGMPLLTHLAESQAECRWLAAHDSEVDSFLAQKAPPGSWPLSITWKGHGLSPTAHLASHKLLTSTTVCAHVIHLSEKDLACFAQAGAKAVHCPRSNARLKNGAAPLAKLIEAGIAVGFGTDSSASCDDLNVLSEASFAWKLASLLNPEFQADSYQAIFRLTLGAAEILNLDSEIGSLAPGKDADLAVFAIDGRAEEAGSRPYDLLLYGGTTLTDSFVRGKRIVKNGIPCSHSDCLINENAARSAAAGSAQSLN